MSRTPSSLFSSRSSSAGDDGEAAVTSPSQKPAATRPTSTAAPTTIVHAAEELRNALTTCINTLRSLNAAPIAVSGQLKLDVKLRDTTGYSISVRASSESSAEDVSDSFDIIIAHDAEEVGFEEEENEARELKDGSHTDRKRSHGEELASALLDASPKRRRTSRQDDNAENDKEQPAERVSNASGQTAAYRNAASDAHPLAPDAPSDNAVPLTLQDLHSQFSKQIRWVEDCRRIADTAHDAREEKWRTTSATFHDNTRKDREVHDKWMVGEVTRHGNMLSQLISDVKALYPLMHTMKWETPSSITSGPPPLPQPLPTQQGQAAIATSRTMQVTSVPPERRGPGRPRKDATFANGSITAALTSGGVKSGSNPGNSSTPTLRASKWKIMTVPSATPTPSSNGKGFKMTPLSAQPPE